MTTDNFCFYLQNRLFQTSQTGGQWYSDTSPFSIPCPVAQWYNTPLLTPTSRVRILPLAPGERKDEMTKSFKEFFSLFSLISPQASGTRGRIFSRVRPFYEQAVSDLDP